MKKWVIFLFAFLIPSFIYANNFTLPDYSYDSLIKGKTQIAIVVNEEALTYQTIVDRIKMVAYMSNMKENKQTYEYITNQVIRALIDESVRFQAMKTNDVPATIDHYEKEIQKVAKAKKISFDQLRQAFKKRNISFASLEKQVIVFTGWLDLVKGRYARDLDVSEKEVIEERNQYMLNAGKPEYLLAEIFLSSNGYKSDYDLEQEGYRLLEELKKGASFVALARQFSDGAGAQRGGDMGWVLQGQLPENLDEALRQLSPGTVSVPVQDNTGYHILLLRDKRITPTLKPSEVEISYLRMTMPFDMANDDYDSKAAELEKYRGRMTSCSIAEKIAKKESKISMTKSEDKKLSDLSAHLEAELSVLPDQKPSLLMMEKDGLSFYIVCARDTMSPKIPSFDKVENFLRRQRLDMFQKRMFRDVFQAAYVDVR